MNDYLTYGKTDYFSLFKRFNSQYEYSLETFSYKDDSRSGEYLIDRLMFMPKSIP